MEEPKVSVIIPVYQVEPYLRRCVESVCGQTYRNLEILLVDDGSPDRCGEMCDGFAGQDSRICVIHQENGGLSSARNAALAVCTGDYIMFVDSDDFIADRCVQTMLQTAQDYDADIVQCCFESGSADTFSAQADAHSAVVFDKYAALEGRQYKVTAWGKLYRRRVVGDIRFPVGLINEDDATYYRFADMAEKIVCISDPLYYYFQSPQSIMRTPKTFLREDFLQIYETRIRYFEEKGDGIMVELSHIRFCLVLMLFYMACKKDPKNTNDTEKLYGKFREEYDIARHSSRIAGSERMMFRLFRHFPRLSAWAVNTFKLRK